MMAILVKGHRVKCLLDDGRVFDPPVDFCLAHDPTGRIVDRCVVLVAPYTDLGRDLTGMPRVDLKNAQKYFGSDAILRKATVDLPHGPWSPMGNVVEVFYARTGSRKRRGKYHHPYRDRLRHPVRLEQSLDGIGFRLVLPEGCRLDHRGFVWP